MTRLTSWRQRRRTSLALAVVALRSWGPRQFAAAIIAAAVVAAIIGVATVLIPNPVFARDIPPVWWDYPVWLLRSEERRVGKEQRFHYRQRQSKRGKTEEIELETRQKKR